MATLSGASGAFQLKRPMMY